MTALYRIYGMNASFFTRKVLSLFTYKAIPSTFVPKTIAIKDDVEAKAGTHLMPVVETPDGIWLKDSTHIAFEMDRRFPESPLLPDTPLARMIVLILEDYIDEWLTRHAMHFRWVNATDRAYAGTSLAHDLVGIPHGAEPDSQGRALLKSARDMIEHWALKATEKLDAGLYARAEIEGDWVRLVSLLDQHFACSDFLPGDRPSLADFALHGGMIAHFLHDPTPAALTKAHGPNVLSWYDRMTHARAENYTRLWPKMDDVPETLAPILQHIAMSFHLYLEGNRHAVAAGEKTVSLDFGYGPRQIVARRSTEQCRLETARTFARFSGEEQKMLRDNLDPLGVLTAYAQAV